ncbi:hypothetical protein [Pontibacter populi]|uniref:Uncharacterized protein n=1 Tax=Pontibacter populi TaxID=890055 RepID=A0ABV1RW38_9BACT
MKRLLGLFRNKPVCYKLQRSERYQAKYKAWTNSTECKELTAAFYKAYHYKKAGVQCSFRVQLINDEHRQGVILFHDPAIPQKAFSYLFDHLKDQVKLQGYKVKSADKRRIVHERYNQQIETYYLTPLPADVPGSILCNQLYGNILIEQTRVNHHPGFIRLIADTIPGSFFSEPLPFADLLSHIMQPTEKLQNRK